MEPLHTFYLWIFEFYCDSEYGNHGRRNFQAEYGISKVEMMDRFPQECIEDAKGYFNSDEGESGKKFRLEALKHYKLHCQYMSDFYIRENIQAELLRQQLDK